MNGTGSVGASVALVVEGSQHPGRARRDGSRCPSSIARWATPGRWARWTSTGSRTSCCRSRCSRPCRGSRCRPTRSCTVTWTDITEPGHAPGRADRPRSALRLRARHLRGRAPGGAGSRRVSRRPLEDFGFLNQKLPLLEPERQRSAPGHRRARGRGSRSSRSNPAESLQAIEELLEDAIGLADPVGTPNFDNPEVELSLDQTIAEQPGAEGRAAVRHRLRQRSAQDESRPRRAGRPRRAARAAAALAGRHQPDRRRRRGGDADPGRRPVRSRLRHRPLRRRRSPSRSCTTRPASCSTPRCSARTFASTRPSARSASSSATPRKRAPPRSTATANPATPDRAAFTVNLKDDASDHRYRLSELSTSLVNVDLQGAIAVDLPVFCPTQNDALDPLRIEHSRPRLLDRRAARSDQRRARAGRGGVHLDAGSGPVHREPQHPRRPGRPARRARSRFCRCCSRR